MGDLNKTRYTHRDYETLKSDLISAIPSLTQEWTGREDSDPGIVLIKLMSMLGDTLSYNIDKIALELFLQTVTQRKNCSKILSLLGYKMHWYRSGTVGVHVRLVSEYDVQGNPNHVVLYPFRTTFKTSSGDITYTLISDGPGSGEIDILSQSRNTLVRLVEGKVIRVTFGRNNLVNNRYYFSENNVDESHLWLTFGSSHSFDLVDNLYLVTDDTRGSFEFNVDEYDRPYIELIKYWEDIVGSSASTAQFTLYYFLSSGSSGNVARSQLVRVQEAGGTSSASDVLIISHPGNSDTLEDFGEANLYTSVGYSPQTVEEAKKDSANYVFTHDTLVTASDFEKAARRVSGITASKAIDNEIIRYENESNSSVLSEVSAEIATRCYDDFGTVIEEDASGKETTLLKPYQAIMYLLYRGAESNTDSANGPVESSNEYTVREGQYRFSSYDLFNLESPEEDSPFYGLGYFPYKPNSFILTQVSDLIADSQKLNAQCDFGTSKIFPFRVNGVVHLNEPISPQDTLLVATNIDLALNEYYYPGTNISYGDMPRFMDIVEVVRGSDINIRYFDADSSLIEWSKVCIMSKFDSMSFAKYNGLHQNFMIDKKFLKFRIKNTSTETVVLESLTRLRNGISDNEDQEWNDEGVVYDDEGFVVVPDEGEDVEVPGWEDTVVKDPFEDKDAVKVLGRSFATIQLENLNELKVFCDDLKANTSLSYVR